MHTRMRLTVRQGIIRNCIGEDSLNFLGIPHLGISLGIFDRKITPPGLPCELGNYFGRNLFKKRNRI